MFTDLGGIELADKVLVGPNVTIISVNHPLDPEKRHGVELKSVLIKAGCKRDNLTRCYG